MPPAADLQAYFDCISNSGIAAADNQPRMSCIGGHAALRHPLIVRFKSLTNSP